MRHQIDQFDGSAIDTFCSEPPLSNAADQLPTVPKSWRAYAARGCYAVLGSMYYAFISKGGCHKTSKSTMFWLFDWLTFYHHLLERGLLRLGQIKKM